ncbi:UPF0561 protein C2orf68 homolog isoform X2 [Actinia tenebrosa]|uniref:UPF0561 protein C2orf68 homolog isoform X2 n=1 Tax=Actinia tenebrosa TaxID=6105 RepID=A0A6P8HSW2_ACTTE|nr:UPF0561 protein C2orf68 homolog isoform X2 [Actinia tenebrosa]
MNHGFVQSIIRNQIDRDEYDKDQRLLKLEKERQLLSGEIKEERKRKEKRAPLHQVYVPPHMRKGSTSTEQSPTTLLTKESSESELLLQLEFEGKDGKMSYLNITKTHEP